MKLFQYFTDNNLFYNHQYGFRKYHSTELALLQLVDRLYTDIDNKKLHLAVFLEVSKAFDTIDHNILLQKLNHYGINVPELNWFQSYLSDRTQFVDIEGVHSQYSHIHISTAVPQGSILGPLLFQIYINDLSTARKFTSIIYADDTHLLSTLCNFHCDPSNLHQLSNNINTELTKVSEEITPIRYT